MTDLTALKELIREIGESEGRQLTCKVNTFGCQMNARDSEKLLAILLEAGFEETDSDEADFVLFNTCTIRENAAERLYGRLGALKRVKERRPWMKVALCGCMMQEKDGPERIRKSYPFVELIFGTHNLYRFPDYLYRLYKEEKRVKEIWDKPGEIVEDLPVHRKYAFKSGVNISYGCNNFCTYCIVPYVRGPERSRRSGDIIRELKALSADGVSEVMLLGQNVNSYGLGLEDEPDFPGLLRLAAEVEGIRRIRFMTSHPKDLSDELIRVMASSEKICRHFHLPLQSGSDRILKAMNRRYTKEHYLSLVEKLRSAMPDISITTDIIVGFPGETEQDVDETIDVVRRAGFDNAYTFQYSPRKGTPAASFEEQVPPETVQYNFDRLLSEVQEMARKRAKLREGELAEVLVEGINERDSSLLTGRMSQNLLVHFPGSPEKIGSYLRVSLTECRGFYYLGKEE